MEKSNSSLADVSKVIPIDDTDGIGHLFDGFCVPRPQSGPLSGRL